MDLIISHAHCPDGFCAAFVAKKRYPEAEVMFLDHGLEPPYEAIKGLDALVLDFSWRTRAENDVMADLSKSFRILDHHKTAEAVLAGAPYATFDMKRSGAGLAWDYLLGENSGYRASLGLRGWFPRPWYVNYVEDHDLWNHALPDSKAVCAYLGTLPFTFEAWDKLELTAMSTALAFGRGALVHIDHYVREAVQQAQKGILQGYKTAVLNIPYLNCSEVGNVLAKTHEVSLTYFENAASVIQFSLRSEGDIDVSAIAKIFKGGGHMHAAGFQMPYLEGRSLVDRILGRDLKGSIS